MGIYHRGINLIAADDIQYGNIHIDGYEVLATRNYYLYNGHGDVVQLRDIGGSAGRTYSYDAFGVEHNPDPYDTNPFRYCGEYWDVETGTYYLRARYYVPGTGRFMTEDPIMDGLNWYTYCGGNPVMYMDPWGLDAILVNKHIDAASWTGIDHMSAFFQDENNQWWFFFFGEDVKYHKVEFDGTFKSYDDIFKNIDSINAYLLAHGLYAIEDVNYHSSVYVVGNFTESHKGALQYLSNYNASLET